ncbi:MAG: ribonuclease P protein component [Alistipes sp.]|nr:ribonuclease P protein component [Alistipes sp.]
MDKRLPKLEKLRSFGAIRRLFTEGRGGFVYPLRYVVYAEHSDNDEMSVEVLFSTPKKFLKRANKRNKVRRRMREAYRLNKHLLYTSEDPRMLHVALIYSSKEVIDFNTIENATKRILENLAK